MSQQFNNVVILDFLLIHFHNITLALPSTDIVTIKCTSDTEFSHQTSKSTGEIIEEDQRIYTYQLDNNLTLIKNKTAMPFCVCLQPINEAIPVALLGTHVEQYSLKQTNELHPLPSFMQSDESPLHSVITLSEETIAFVSSGLALTHYLLSNDIVLNNSSVKEYYGT